MVWARSNAEIPVDTLRRASIETQKAVPYGDVLLWSDTINGMFNSSNRWPVIGRQIRPRPWVAMKLTASGVTFSAAIIRSPSFSRSSSSTMLTMRPSFSSVMASSIVTNSIRFDQSLDILGYDVELQIHRISGLTHFEVRILECMRNYCDRKNARTLQCGYCQADAVDRNRTFFNDVTRTSGWIFDLQTPCIAFTVEFTNPSDSVHMALHDMTAKAGFGTHWSLEIHDRTSAEFTKTGAIESLA